MTGNPVNQFPECRDFIAIAGDGNGERLRRWYDHKLIIKIILGITRSVKRLVWRFSSTKNPSLILGHCYVNYIGWTSE